MCAVKGQVCQTRLMRDTPMGCCFIMDVIIVNDIESNNDRDLKLAELLFVEIFANDQAFIVKLVSNDRLK